MRRRDKRRRRQRKRGYKAEVFIYVGGSKIPHHGLVLKDSDGELIRVVHIDAERAILERGDGSK